MNFQEIITNSQKNTDFFDSRLKHQLNKAISENVKFNALLSTENFASRQATLDSSEELFGLSFTAKDCFFLAKHTATFGLKPPLLTQAPRTAAICELLFKKGCSLLGTTNMDVGSIGSFGDNPYYGRMINPINDQLIAGGSSGGAAISVARDWCDFAIGSDHGGSIRIPAAVSNLCGLRLSSNLFSKEGSFLFENEIDSIGIITKNTTNLKFLIQTLLPTQQELPALSEIKIFIPCEKELAICSKQIRQEFEKYLRLVETSLKISIVQLKTELGFSECMEIRKILIAKLFKNLIEKRNYSAPSLPPQLLSLLLFAKQVTSSQQSQSLADIAKIKQHAENSLQKGQFIITPTLPYPTPTWAEVDDRTIEHLPPINALLAFANVADLPAISFHQELPYQLIGAQGCDYQIAALASHLSSLG